MFERTRDIFMNAAGSLADKANAHKKKLMLGLGAAAASPMLYDRAVQLGRQAYSYGRKASNISDMVESADPDSPETKHRRRIIANAQKKLMLAELGPQGNGGAL